MRKTSIELTEYNHSEDSSDEKIKTATRLIDPNDAIKSFKQALEKYKESLSFLNRKSQMTLVNMRIPSHEEIRKNSDLAVLNFLSAADRSDIQDFIDILYEYLKAALFLDNDGNKKVSNLRTKLHLAIMKDPGCVCIDIKNTEFPHARVYLDLNRLTFENASRVVREISISIKKEIDIRILQNLDLDEKNYQFSLADFFDSGVSQKIKIQVLSRLFGIYLKNFSEAKPCIEALKNYLLMHDFSNPDSGVHIMSRKYWNSMFDELEKQCMLQNSMYEKHHLSWLKEEFSKLNGPESIWVNVRGDSLYTNMLTFRKYVTNKKLEHILNVKDSFTKRDMYLSPESVAMLHEFPLTEQISFWMAAYGNGFESMAKQCSIHTQFELQKHTNSQVFFQKSLENKNLAQMCIAVMDLNKFELSKMITEKISSLDKQQISLLFSMPQVREIFHYHGICNLLPLVHPLVRQTKTSIEPLLACNLSNMKAFLTHLYPLNGAYSDEVWYIDFFYLLANEPKTVDNIYSLIRFMGWGVEFLKDIVTARLSKIPYQIQIDNFNKAREAIISMLKRDVFENKDVQKENVAKWMLIKEADILNFDTKCHVGLSMFKVVKKELGEAIDNKACPAFGYQG